MVELHTQSSDTAEYMAQLKSLDDSLRCGICFEYFNVAVMTECSHTYCSYCIRKYMTYNAQCPSCFKETAEPSLKTNRIVDEIVSKYSAFRLSLKVSFSNETDDCGTTGPNEPQHESLNSGPTTRNSERKNRGRHRSHTPEDNENIPVPESASRSTTSNTQINCPICSVEISPENINRHLDTCLQRQEQQKTPRNQSPRVEKRKPLAKVIYNLLKEKDLKKIMKDLGLNTIGNKQTLIKRHQQFVVIYNAECDSLNPKSAAEIAEIVHNQEKNEKTCGSNSSQLVVPVTRKTEPQIIEAEQEKYRRNNKSQFKELANKIKKRMKSFKDFGKSPSPTKRESSTAASTKQLILPPPPSQPSITAIPSSSSTGAHRPKVARRRILPTSSSSTPSPPNVDPSIATHRNNRTTPSPPTPRRRFAHNKVSTPIKSTCSTNRLGSPDLLHKMDDGDSSETCSDDDLPDVSLSLIRSSEPKFSTAKVSGRVTATTSVSTDKVRTGSPSPRLSKKRNFFETKRLAEESDYSYGVSHRKSSRRDESSYRSNLFDDITNEKLRGSDDEMFSSSAESISILN